MKKITLSIFGFFTTLIFLSAQSTITVDNSPGSAAQFNDLQTAISNATSGDIIYVHPSETNYGNIELDKSAIEKGHADVSSQLDEVVRKKDLKWVNSDEAFPGSNE